MLWVILKSSWKIWAQKMKIESFRQVWTSWAPVRAQNDLIFNNTGNLFNDYLATSHRMTATGGASSVVDWESSSTSLNSSLVWTSPSFSSVPNSTFLNFKYPDICIAISVKVNKMQFIHEMRCERVFESLGSNVRVWTSFWIFENISLLGVMRLSRLVSSEMSSVGESI